MEMEKEQQKWEQAEVGEHEKEEASQLVRKSKAGNDSKAPEIAADGVEVGNGTSGANGHRIQSSGAANEEEQKIEELDRALDNEPEAANGEQRIEELHGILGDVLEAVNGEHKIKGLDVVPQNDSEAIHGKHNKSTDLVFYDKVEGIWKCRICSWIYRNGSVCVDHFQNHKGHLHMLMSVKNLIFETEGIESPEFGVKTNPISAIYGGGVKNNTLSSSSLQASQISHQESSSSDIKSLNEIESAEAGLIIKDDLDETDYDVENVIQKQNREGVKKITLSSSSLQSSQISHQESSSSGIKSLNEIESAEADLIIEDDLDETDYDVENVIQKQNTHDLYCPNCKSCITKRVILRKRKRGIRINDEEAKRNKIEAGVGLNVGAGLVREPSDELGLDDTEIRRKDDEERERGPAIFKCLSCFTIFIPRKFLSLFSSNKQDTAVVQGSTSQSNVQKGGAEVRQSFNLGGQSGQPSIVQNPRSPTEASKGEDKSVLFPRQKSSLNGNVGGEKLDTKTAEKIEATMELFESYTGDQLEESKPKQEGYSAITPPKKTQVTNGESSEDSISFPKQDGLKFSISSNKGSADKGQILGDGADVDGNLNISLAIPHQEQDVTATIQTDSVVDNKYTNFKSSKSGHFYPTEMSQHIVNETKLEFHSGEPLKFDNMSAVNSASFAQGKDTVITIDARPAGSSQHVQGTMLPAESATPLLSATPIITTGGDRTEAREELKIEVVKSIVYGGLSESITSLSVVSSAAGGGAATLNILALGMANLIGGLLIICHNLWELKSDRIEEVSNQISDQVVHKQRDRYKQLLGRRENFILHAVVALISYIIFGLVPPIVYGFSFRKTDDKELKLFVVAASSLICIVFLAIGRAYVRRPPKPYLQSVTTYVILGFIVSGVSYGAGILVERILQKLGLFESSSVSNLFLPDMGKGGSAWASF